MRILALVMIALLSLSASDGPGGPAVIRATPVPLNRDVPKQDRLGALRYLGGWRLNTTRKDFGGISSLAIKDGGFLALSDTGLAYHFHLDPSGAPSPVTFIPLPAGPGKTANKADRDSESMIVDPKTGQIWVGFENWNAIWRYAPNFDHGEANVQPQAMSQWPANSGPEAMVWQADGSFLVFAEEAFPGTDLTEVLRFDSDPTSASKPPLSIRYRPPAGYDPTDAAALPDGRLLVLQRRFSLFRWFGAVLSIVDPKDIEPGKAWQGHEIARFEAPITVDNYEALAIEPRADGKLVLWIASDDNFNPLERTLLLKFELDPDALSPIEKSPPSALAKQKPPL